MAENLLFELGVIVATALVLSLIFHRLGLPMITGQIFAGILIGPYGPFGTSLVQNTEVIQLLASLGIILLLFVIGLEFDPREIYKIGLKALALTFTEFLVAFTAGFFSGLAIGWSLSDSFLLGSLLSISSTAIVAKMVLDNMHDPDHRQRAVLLTVLIIEDVIAVLLLLSIPELAAGNQIGLDRILTIAVKGALLVVGTVGFGRFVAPRIINRVSQHEIDVGEATFLLALSFAFVFGTISDYLGFSPAIGAFLIGLTLLGKHSRYVKEKIMPLKDLFVVFFFVSMGTLIDVRTALFLGPALALIIVGKLFGGALGARLVHVGSPIVMGASLVSRGEFSLVLAKAAADSGYATAVIYPVVGVTVLITSFSPTIIHRLRISRNISEAGRKIRTGHSYRHLVLALLIITVLTMTTAAIWTGPNVSSSFTGFQYIVAIVLENNGLNATYGAQCLGNCTYITLLANNYGLAMNYSSVAHPSLSNYLTMTSGGNYSYQPFLADCSPTMAGCSLSGKNLVDRLEGSGWTWKAYMEDYTGGGCSLTSTSQYYVNDHNPFVYYNDIVNNTARCARILDANPGSMGYLSMPTKLFSDLNSPTAPNFMWLTPNLCNNGHNQCKPLNNTVSQTNQYLNRVVPNILNSTIFKMGNAALLITWDEGGHCPSPGQTYPKCTDRVTAIWAGPMIKQAYKSSVAYSHYSFLKTMEVAWKFASLSLDGNATPMTEFFVVPPFAGGGRALIPLSIGTSYYSGKR